MKVEFVERVENTEREHSGWTRGCCRKPSESKALRPVWNRFLGGAIAEACRDLMYPVGSIDDQAAGRCRSAAWESAVTELNTEPNRAYWAKNLPL